MLFLQSWWALAKTLQETGKEIILGLVVDDAGSSGAIHIEGIRPRRSQERAVQKKYFFDVVEDREALASGHVCSLIARRDLSPLIPCQAVSGTANQAYRKSVLLQASGDHGASLRHLNGNV